MSFYGLHQSKTLLFIKICHSKNLVFKNYDSAPDGSRTLAWLHLRECILFYNRRFFSKKIFFNTSQRSRPQNQGMAFSQNEQRLQYLEDC